MYKSRCAYHEAGHAVAALTLGIPVVRVAVSARRGARRSAGISGRTTTSGEWYYSTYRQELIVLLAGPHAEARYRKCSVIACLLAGFRKAESDWGQVDAILELLPKPDRDAVYDEVEGQARQLVKEQWSEIRLLAERLAIEGVVLLEPEKAEAAANAAAKQGE